MKALLALEDGFVLEGESFTGPIDLAGGEVIFNTAMTGYQELITDPSYTGQMVCMTWPLIGNYGINPDDMESDRVHMSALLVKECCKEPSNWRSTETLAAFLARHRIPGVEGLDTRALTLHLRKAGAMRGAISTKILEPEELIAEARKMPSMEGRKLTPRRSPPAEPPPGPAHMPKIREWWSTTTASSGTSCARCVNTAWTCSLFRPISLPRRWTR